MKFNFKDVQVGHPWWEKLGSDLDRAKQIIDSDFSIVKIVDFTGINKVTIGNLKRGQAEIEKAQFSTIQKLARMWDVEYIGQYTQNQEFIQFVQKFAGFSNELIFSQKELAADEGLDDDVRFVGVLNKLSEMAMSDILFMIELFEEYKEEEKEMKHDVKLVGTEVIVDDSAFGEFKFDKDQEAWVFWPNSIDDGVTYFEDLQESFETVKDEVNQYDDPENVDR